VGFQTAFERRGSQLIYTALDLMNIFIHQENPVATKRKEKKQTNLIK